MLYFDFHSHTIRKESNIVSLFNLPPEGFCISVSSMYTSAGIHPGYVSSKEEAIRRFCKQWNYYHPVAVGEVGLDQRAESEMELQEELFEMMASFAKEQRKPLIIHCVRAWSNLLKIRRKFLDELWIVHGFRGKVELAKQLIDTGMYLSFGQYFNEASLKFAWGVNRMLLETDDASIGIEEVYGQVISLLDLELEKLSINQKINFEYLFG